MVLAMYITLLCKYVYMWPEINDTKIALTTDAWLQYPTFYHCVAMHVYITDRYNYYVLAIIVNDGKTFH